MIAVRDLRASRKSMKLTRPRPGDTYAAAPAEQVATAFMFTFASANCLVLRGDSGDSEAGGDTRRGEAGGRARGDSAVAAIAAARPPTSCSRAACCSTEALTRYTCMRRTASSLSLGRGPPRASPCCCGVLLCAYSSVAAWPGRARGPCPAGQSNSSTSGSGSSLSEVRAATGRCRGWLLGTAVTGAAAPCRFPTCPRNTSLRGPAGSRRPGVAAPKRATWSRGGHGAARSALSAAERSKRSSERAGEPGSVAGERAPRAPRGESPGCRRGVKRRTNCREREGLGAEFHARRMSCKS